MLRVRRDDKRRDIDFGSFARIPSCSLVEVLAMLEKMIVSKIDNLLDKYQFRKIGAVWNRESADFIDAIDLQVGKSGDTFAINVGVAEKTVLTSCWGWHSSEVVEEASCTVRVRLGELMSGRDVWWSFADEVSIDEVLSGIENAAIPFLQINHSIDRMIDTLEGKSSARSYPPEAIYLALLHHRRGDSDRSLNMLRTLQAKLTGGWCEKVSGILNGLS
jgi:hypothetical protein